MRILPHPGQFPAYTRFSSTSLLTHPRPLSLCSDGTCQQDTAPDPGPNSKHPCCFASSFSTACPRPPEGNLLEGRDLSVLFTTVSLHSTVPGTSSVTICGIHDVSVSRPVAWQRLLQAGDRCFWPPPEPHSRGAPGRSMPLVCAPGPPGPFCSTIQPILVDPHSHSSRTQVCWPHFLN